MKPSPETMRARMYDDRGALNDSTLRPAARHLLLYFYKMHYFLDFWRLIVSY